MEPVHIDLRNLTQEHLAQCKRHMGACSYDAPCVIGALIPVGRRGERWLDAETALKRGQFIAPADQHDDICAMQRSFDASLWSHVERIASKYIGATEVAADSAEVAQ